MLFLAVFGIGIVCKISKASFGQSRIQSMMFRFLNFSAILISYFLALPIFQIYLTVVICVKEREAYGDLVCYEGIYFFHFFIAIMGIIAHIIISVTSVVHNSDLSPFSSAANASPQNRPQLYRLFIKLILAFFALVTYKVYRRKILT